jgi:hypothetical protein
MSLGPSIKLSFSQVMLSSCQRRFGGSIMAVQVRTLSMEETQELNQLAHVRKAPHRLVQRAQIIWASAQGLNAPAIT